MRDIPKLNKPVYHPDKYRDFSNWNSYRTSDKWTNGVDYKSNRTNNNLFDQKYTGDKKKWVSGGNDRSNGSQRYLYDQEYPGLSSRSGQFGSHEGRSDRQTGRNGGANELTRKLSNLSIENSSNSSSHRKPDGFDKRSRMEQSWRSRPVDAIQNDQRPLHAQNSSDSSSHRKPDGFDGRSREVQSGRSRRVDSTQNDLRDLYQQYHSHREPDGFAGHSRVEQPERTGRVDATQNDQSPLHAQNSSDSSSHRKPFDRPPRVKQIWRTGDYNSGSFADKPWRRVISEELRQQLSYHTLETVETKRRENALEIKELVKRNPVKASARNRAERYTETQPSSRESLDSQIDSAKKYGTILEGYLDELYEMRRKIWGNTISQLNSIESCEKGYYDRLRSYSTKTLSDSEIKYYEELLQEQDIWWQYCDKTKDSLTIQAKYNLADVDTYIHNTWKELKNTMNKYFQLERQKQRIEIDNLSTWRRENRQGMAR